MRQRRVTTLAFPLPAANGQKVSAVWAIDLECHRWHEGAAILVRKANALGASPAGEGALEELADLAIRIWEVACSRVPVVGGYDKAPTGGQALDESPEVIAAELVGSVAGQRVEALARA